MQGVFPTITHKVTKQKVLGLANIQIFHLLTVHLEYFKANNKFINLSLIMVSDIAH